MRQITFRPCCAALQLWAEIERARGERDAADALVNRLTGTLELLLASLPPADKTEYRLRADKAATGPYTRAGKAYDNVIELFKHHGYREWSIPEIQAALSESGKEVDLKVLYNSINYLAKTGRLQRVARGRYVVRGIGIALDLEGVPEDGSVRPNENDE